MIAKIAVLFAVVAVAYGGLVQVPASTVPLAHAAPVLTYAAAPAAVAYAAPVAVAHAAPVAIPAPVAYSTGAKVVHTYEPVEQHGYQIAY